VSENDHAKGVKMTRPLCAYPQAARYKGTGDTDNAANFECVPPLGQIYPSTQLSVTAPRALHTPEPEYSKSARERGIHGIVKLYVVIGTDGRAHDVKVVESLEPSLDAIAIETVKKWKFAPATKDGRPVAVAMTLEIDYKLR
jgi:TonB family protein